MMMEKQLEEGRKELDECERVKEKVEEKLRDMGSLGQEKDLVHYTTSAKVQNGETNDTRRLWQAIHDMDGD